MVYMKRWSSWVSSNFWPLLPALVGLLAIAMLAVGCSAASTQRPWPVAAEVHAKGPPVAKRNLGSAASLRRPVTAATLVERSLRDRGLDFGTDGSVQALYSYAISQHEAVDPRQARPGDLLFFDSAAEASGCGNHVGLVEGIAPGGAIKFRERRDNEERTSIADPLRPARRRDDAGRVINTFMRARQPNDAVGTRYYAGQMVCSVIRIVK